MPFTPAQHREYRRRLKAEGVCVTCHKRPTREGSVICQTCSDRGMRGLRRRKAKWKATPGACPDCGRPTHGFHYCVSCRRTHSRVNARRTERMVKARYCPQCGHPNPADTQRCPVCCEMEGAQKAWKRSLHHG